MSSTQAQPQPQREILPSWADKNTATRYVKMEKGTRPFAAVMVQKAQLAHLTSPVNILDLACGTGAVVKEIYDAVPREKWPQLNILAGDTSEPMLEFLHERAETQGWSGVETRKVDGGDLHLPASSYSHVFVNFGIFMMPVSTTASLFDLLQPGGFLAISSWAYMGWHDILTRALARMADPPRLPSQGEISHAIAKGVPWNDAAFVRKQLEDAGCVDIDVVQQKQRIECGTVPDFIETMASMVQMISRFWDEDKREQLVEDVTKALLEEATEQAGGGDGSVYMNFEPIIASGWKRA